MLDFKREVLTGAGAGPRAERREIAIDLREDWPQALRDSGFDPAKPSAWIAEGLLIYLPASALRSSCSPVSTAWPAPAATSPSRTAPRWTPDDFEAAVAAERAATAQGDGRVFFQLVYNERHAPATDGSASAAGMRSAPRWPTTFAQSAVPCPDRTPKPARWSRATPW